MNWQPIARIVVRYVTGALVGWGVLAPESAQALGADPEVIAMVAAGIGVAVEMLYARAKRTGRPT